MSAPVIDSDDFPRLIYAQTFETIYAYLEEQRRTDPAFTPEKIRQFLKDAYARQGDNWGARGVIEDKKLEAIIAAYECFLAEWEGAPETEGICQQA